MDQDSNSIIRAQWNRFSDVFLGNPDYFFVMTREKGIVDTWIKIKHHWSGFDCDDDDDDSLMTGGWWRQVDDEDRLLIKTGW